MQPRTYILSAFTLSTVMAFGAAAWAADLPQSGTIKTHSTQKGTEQAVQVGEKHFMAYGSVWGVTYNDAGSGPLHMGPFICTLTADDVNGAYKDMGDCAVGNPGGVDKIFMTFSGKGTDGVGENGTGTITGGIGKFAGIQGKMSYECKVLDASQSVFTCTQQFDYELGG